MEIRLEDILMVVKIIIIDLLLSGDNAIVIAMATLRLNPVSRKKAILLGTSGAIMLRVFLTSIGAYIFVIPFLQFLGGLILIWITAKLLIDSSSGEVQGHNIDSPTRLINAIKIIIIADFSMSLDNILAISGASHGNIKMLVFGLIFSIPILMFFSQQIVRLMDKLPFLIYVGVAVLSWVAAEIICTDQMIAQYVKEPFDLILTVAIITGVFIICKIRVLLIRIK